MCCDHKDNKYSDNQETKFFMTRISRTTRQREFRGENDRAARIFS